MILYCAVVIIINSVSFFFSTWSPLKAVELAAQCREVGSLEHDLKAGLALPAGNALHLGTDRDLLNGDGLNKNAVYL